MISGRRREAFEQKNSSAAELEIDAGEGTLQEERALIDSAAQTEQAGLDQLLSAAGRGLGARVVPALGADYKFAMALGFRLHFNLTEFSRLLGTGGLVPDGVLIADIVGDGATDGINFVESLGEECDSAGAFGENL